MDDARLKMLKEVMAADFAAIDLQLYLNTHPYDRRALTVYMSNARRAKMLMENFERMYGPITAIASNSYPWPWIENPWPWDGH
jgi:spore coat protein JB